MKSWYVENIYRDESNKIPYDYVFPYVQMIQDGQSRAYE